MRCNDWDARRTYAADEQDHDFCYLLDDHLPGDAQLDSFLLSVDVLLLEEVAISRDLWSTAVEVSALVEGAWVGER